MSLTLPAPPDVSRMRENIPTGAPKERGAALILVALTMVIVVSAGALAVDLSAMSRRGQTLQNAADAAALAGVRTWVETGDAAQAEAAVADILAQNAVGGAGTTAQVTFPSTNEVDVTITDGEPQNFLAGFAGGAAGVARGARAQFEMCDADCTYEVEIPPPFRDVEAQGSGDGYKPIPVGNRLYAIHHAGSQIVCIDRSTESTCWGSAATYAYPPGHGGRNPQMPHTVVHNNRIWWSASDSQGHKMFCWNTLTDVACPSPVLLDPLPQATPLDNRDEMRGGGTVMVDGRIFVFTDNHKVHCFDPNTVAVCPDYVGGRDSGLGEANFPPNNPSNGNHGGSIDRVTHDGKIYWTLRIVNEEPLGTAVDCTSPLYEPDGAVVLRNVSTGEYIAANPSGSGTEMVIDGNQSLARWDVSSRPGDEWRFLNQQRNRYLDGNRPIRVVKTDDSPDSDDDWELHDWDGSSWRIKNQKRKGWLRHDVFGNEGLGDDLVETNSGTSDEFRWQIWPAPCADPTYVPPPPPTLPYDNGTWLDCWDTTTDAPCADFTPRHVHTNGLRFNGRLFFYRSTTGIPTGVCSTGFDGSISSSNFEIQCHHLDGQGLAGGENSSQTTTMNTYENYIDNSVPSSPSSWGDPHWNDWTNRLYYPAHHNANRLYCWDFASQSYCGNRWQETSGGNTTEDYGYFSEGNCVYALGHNSWFWAFSASSIDDPCTGSSASTVIYPCNCGATMEWGTLTFDIDFDAFLVFDVQLFDPNSNIVQIQGQDSWSLIDDGLEVDLSDVPTIYPYLEVVVTVDADGDPWATGAQTFQISFGRTPVLID